MSTALDSVDIVHIRKDGLFISVIVLKRYVYRKNLVRCHADRLRNKFFGIRIEIFDELAETFLRVEYVFSINLLTSRNFIAVIIDFILIHESSKVCESNLDSLVQECELTHSAGQCIIIVDSSDLENLRVRMESDDGSCIIALTDNFYRCDRFSLRIFLLENLALSMYFSYKQV